MSVTLDGVDLHRLVRRFRPVYWLHSYEAYYPCSFQNLLERCELRKRTAEPAGVVVIPRWKLNPGTAIANPAALEAAGLTLDGADAAALAPRPYPNTPYRTTQSNSSYVIVKGPSPWPPDAFVRGHLDNPDFVPGAGTRGGRTSYHHGGPGCPDQWLGGADAGRCAAEAQAILAAQASLEFYRNPQIAWVQTRSVGGTRYVDLIYTTFFAYNGTISLVPGQGEHYNDMEVAAVRLLADTLEPARYYYSQHSGYAWYLAGELEFHDFGDGDGAIHPVVYHARQSHEAYPHAGRYQRIWGVADDLADRGTLWAPDALYVNRPEGADIDAIRCAVSTSDPLDVAVVPPIDAGPDWLYYVGVVSLNTLLDGDNTSQGVPTFSSGKFWLGEGTIGTPSVAAETSAPGTPIAFFGNAAPYLGEDPAPACPPGHTQSIDSPGPPPVPTYATAPLATSADTVSLPVAPAGVFLDWTGPVGAYLRSVVSSSAIAPFLAGILAKLDPLDLGNPPPYRADGFTVALSSLVVTGLKSLTVSAIGASAATTLTATASAALTVTGECSVTLDGVGTWQTTLTATTKPDLGLAVELSMITPLVVTDDGTWYVPDVAWWSPIQSIDQAQSNLVDFAQVSTITLTWVAPLITLSRDGLPSWANDLLSAVATVAASILEAPIEDAVEQKLRGAINAELANLYNGVIRLG